MWVAEDGTWSWKDEDELEQAVALARFTEDETQAVRAAGERLLGVPPWPTGWEGWRPDADWPVPVLPTGWDTSPP